MDDRPSKSQRKRDSLGLQKLGERLVEMPPSELENVPLTDEIREAVNQARTIPPSSAQRRQIRHIGALLRREDPEPILAHLEGTDRRHSTSSLTLRLAESWRDRLLEGDERLLAHLMERFPEAHGLNLNQLIHQARRERTQGRQPRSARMLFRHLRSLADTLLPENLWVEGDQA